jgi:selenide,water dikinase
MEKSDDAGVFRIRDDLAIIQSLDFFTPIVNDPYQFGQIAAANSLSDIYAMGGTPITAMNILCYPKDSLPIKVVRDILRGGLDKVHEAGAFLLGGHSVDDNELKYGLSVSGLIHPDRVVRNDGAKLGDRLLLTKPLGTGILATALKGKMASERTFEILFNIMASLNKDAAEAMVKIGVHACTDVTGFGLLGHALEMAMASCVEITLFSSKIPLIPEAVEFARMGFIPAGTYANRNFCTKSMVIEEGVDPVVADIMADAQTSGGLLISVPSDKVEALRGELRNRGVLDAEIGEVTCEGKGMLRVIP